MAWLALGWKTFGQSIVVTRCAMLLMAAFSLLGFFRLARTVANTSVAIASTSLVAIYPVFFAQSSLAQIDLPSAGFVFWGLESYFRTRQTEVGARAPWPVPWAAVIWFSLAALTKETAILAPLALLCCELVSFLLKTKTSAAKFASTRANVGMAKSHALAGHAAG